MPAPLIPIAFLAVMVATAGACGGSEVELVSAIPCDHDGGCPLGLSLRGEPWVVACSTTVPRDALGEVIWTGAVSPGSGEWTAVMRLSDVDDDLAVAVEGSVPGCTGGDAPILAVPLEDREPGWPERAVDRKELVRRFEP